MKLRMRENSIRLRLTRSEVARFAEFGRLDEVVEFPSGTLRYTIARSNSERDVTANLIGGTIAVCVPDEIAHEWISTPRVSIETRRGSLEILIEKDFQCQHGAPDSDAFPRHAEEPALHGPLNGIS